MVYTTILLSHTTTFLVSFALGAIQLLSSTGNVPLQVVGPSEYTYLFSNPLLIGFEKISKLTILQYGNIIYFR